MRNGIQRFKDWLGFFEYKDSRGEIHPGKTLWDWLGLLIVPVVLAIAAIWFNQSAEVRSEAIEAERAGSILLQRYFETMETLLLDKNLLHAPKGSEERAVARAITLASLSTLNGERKYGRSLDGERKGLILQFLYEAGLISYDSSGDPPVDRPIVDLSGADLEYLEWYEASLAGADLSGTILFRADLSKADLKGVNFEGALLLSTDLDHADLSNANLIHAIIPDSQLIGVKSLKGAIMTDGKVYDPSIHVFQKDN